MKRGRSEYVASSYSDDEKKVLAAVALTFRERGETWEAILRFLLESGYELKERTLRTWVKLHGQGRTPISEAKQSGRKRSLNDEQEAVLIGFFFGDGR